MPSPAVLQTGRHWPLGAQWDGAGVNVAVFSQHATAVELCLFDAAGAHEVQRLTLPGRTDDVWHGYLPDAGPGLVYGFRAHGPWEPHEGHRFNPAKLLLDPWARELVGRFEWRCEQFGFELGHAQHADTRDNAPWALKARVVDDAFDWGDDRPPAHDRADLRLYELHVKGFTALHPDVAPPQRGTYAGLASDAAIAHLQRLGVNAVSLLPVHEHIDEQRLVARGLSNYWGYNTVGFFAPERRYAAGPDARGEFRRMVQRLHAAGIEVILDVVFNHTAETDALGPTIAWRGLDNRSWYRLDPHDRSRYENLTGCGNTLDLRQPRVLQFVLDSLRHWVADMHVDGFRFDLAPVLARGTHGFEDDHPFFHAVAQDPVLARVRLIAEPWDVGHGGYQLGQFPAGWMEWNDRFRDGMRGFWVAAAAHRGEFAQRLCASSDVFHRRARLPFSSVNYVVSHDGFTLRDLLTYEHRRNEANGEGNRDGHGHNLGWNCGIEGETDDDAVRDRRARLQRALLATVLLAQGTPMLAAGDEMGHTQRGNNNPYCQDNGITWIDWARADEALLTYTAALVRLRAAWLPLEGHWYDGHADGRGVRDLSWHDAAGHALRPEDWHAPDGRALVLHIGKPQRAPAPLLLLVNAARTPTSVRLPVGRWRSVVDSGLGFVAIESGPCCEGPLDVIMPAHDLRLLALQEP
jgi:glycogen operon protein